MTDIILATIPIFFLKDLQINHHTKIALCILMGAGYLTAACCIVRTALSGQVLETDVTYAVAPSAAWRGAEVNLGITCANAPILRPLYLWYRGRLQTRRVNHGFLVTTRDTPRKNSKMKLCGRRWRGESIDTGGSERPTMQVELSRYTSASAELGLPIESHLMGERSSSIGNNQ